MKKLLLFLPLLFLLFSGQKVLKDGEEQTTKTVVEPSKVSVIVKVGSYLLAYSGKLTVPKMSGADTIAKPLMDTLVTDKTNDSVRVTWYNDTHWYVENITGKDMIYNGVFSSEYGKNFVIGELIDNKGNKVKPQDLMIDREKGIYRVTIKAGWKLDPGYASAPLPIGCAMRFGYKNDSTYAMMYNSDSLKWWAPVRVQDTSKIDSVKNIAGAYVKSMWLRNGAVVQNGAGKVGAGLFFDGTDAVGILRGGTVGAWTLPWTVNMWLKYASPYSGSDNPHILGDSSLNQFFNTTSVIANPMTFGLNTSAGTRDMINLPAVGTWFNVTITKSATGGVFNAYLNGVAGTQKTVSLTPSGDLVFGNTVYSTISLARDYHGWMDRIYMTKRVITQTGINTQYKSTRDSLLSDTTNGLVYCDTVGVSADSIRFKRKASADSITLPVVASNTYQIHSVFLLTGDSTYTDSTSDTVVIAQGKQVIKKDSLHQKSLDTIQVIGVNDIGAGQTTEYLPYLSRTTQRIYDYDTLSTPTITPPLVPASGTIAGGTTVVISGAGFYTNATVTFGGTAAASYGTRTTTSITCVTPAHAVGAVDVVVTNQYGLSATSTGGFTFTNPSKKGFRGGYKNSIYKNNIYKNEPYKSDVYK